MQNSFNKYEGPLAFVQNALIANGGETPLNGFQSFRKRSAHCKRVLGWCNRLLINEPNINVDKKVLFLSAVFHDAGYNSFSEPHEQVGARVFQEYAEKHSLDEFLFRKVEANILMHSDKSQLNLSDTPIERILLMEADLLDEEGAMGIVADCLTVAQQTPDSMGYDKVLQQLYSFASEILEHSPMITPYAKRCWSQKQCIVSEFIAALKNDLLF